MGFTMPTLTGNYDNISEPRRFQFGRQIKMRLLRVLLCGKDKMPRDFEGRFPNTPIHNTGGHLMGYWTVVVMPTPAGSRKSSTHRIFIECACGRLVPAGRLQQHGYGCPKAYEAREIK